jgi:hypothetical protein
VQTTSGINLDLRPSHLDMEALLQRLLPSPERRAVIEAMSKPASCLAALPLAQPTALVASIVRRFSRHLPTLMKAPAPVY